jgi:hypothetical protein
MGQSDQGCQHQSRISSPPLLAPGCAWPPRPAALIKISVGIRWPPSALPRAGRSRWSGVSRGLFSAVRQ